MKTEKQAFIAGYFDGRKYKRLQSMKEVLDAHPSLTAGLASVFMNGQEDGTRNDSFRYDISRNA